MGDYFTRLAERTLGLAPVVRPDLMPVLLPVAESVPVSDAVPRREEPLERTTTPARKSPPADADSQSQSMSVTEIVTVAGDAPPSLRQSWHHQVTPPARAGGAVDWQIDAPDRAPRAVESPTAMTQMRQNVVELDSNPPNPVFKTAEKTAPAEIRQATQAHAALAQPHLSEVRPMAAPAIQIAIGSVEIRAVTPAPTAVPQRSAARRVAARLSLEEYLRQRNEGRR